MRANVAFLSLLAAMAIPAHAADDSRTVIKESRPVGAVDAVVISGTVDTDVTVGGSPQLILEGSKEDLDRIRTEQRGSTLYIENTRHWQLEFCLFGCITRTTLKAHIVVPNLVEFDNDGAGDAFLQGLSGEVLRVRLSSAGDVTAEGHTQSLILSASSSGDAHFQRFTADSMDVDLSGSGDFASGGTRKNLKLRVSSSGDARLSDIDVDSMDAELDGAGEVFVQGKAKSLTLSMSSSGDARLDDFSANDMDLHMSGSGDLHTGDTAGKLQLSMSSSGDAHLRHLAVESADVDVSGSGGVVAEGTAKDLHLSVSSSGDANFGRVTAESVEATDSGSGDISVIADTSIRAMTESSGDIIWRGSAEQVNVQSNGGGEIRHR